jgi:hypothetical protein
VQRMFAAAPERRAPGVSFDLLSFGLGVAATLCVSTVLAALVAVWFGNQRDGPNPES